ncbi:MAG TPA: hypothetical protein DEF47_03075 [Herpetosiphon sp.]|uniref:Uncharacterized protein n=1 Tax=Herpetosiphon aurantiacus (strain ATCC 23779 / DSM 785 / 114-95) TaxID=316274 RepID=A9B683_HERA2|nr:hypothetical protein [Herpetosiphon sp.]ABX06294.1 hypothetical protein Haur_3658 [Herpetosiphon aurantiacus DSM 785]HBW48874.1 hypothetical protein [Herpetosiphon sp.]
MKCPNCYSNVSNSTEKCPRCDWPLRAPAAATSSAAFGESPTANAWGRDQTNDAGVWEPTMPASAAWEQPTAEPASTWDQAPLQSVAPPPNATMMGNAMPTTVTLTSGQKTQLLFGAFFPLIILAIPIWFIGGSGGSEEISFFWFILGLFGLVVGWQAIMNLADFFSGVAQVQVDRLTKTQVVKNKNSRTYYGHFERIGRLNIGRENYDGAFQGAIYQVTYSPRSKRLWAMQQLG